MRDRFLASNILSFVESVACHETRSSESVSVWALRDAMCEGCVVLLFAHSIFPVARSFFVRFVTDAILSDAFALASRLFDANCHFVPAA